MTEKNSHEWLSAYLDGELRGDERNEAEQRLDSSTDERSELRQFEQMSALLQELPGERPPEEFAARVMFAAERRSILPQPTSAATSWSLRRIGAMAISIAGIAVCVVIAVHLVAQLGEDRQDAQTLATATKAAGEGAADEAESTTPAKLNPMSESMSFRESTATPEAKTIAGDAAPVEPARKGALSLPNGVRLTKDSIGQLIDAVQTTAGSVVIVKVVVIDVEQGIGGIEVLLQRHSVTEVQPATESFGATHDKASGEIAALYVESTPTQIAAILSEMGTLNEKGKLVLKLESNQVALADLPADPQSFFSDAVGAKTEAKAKSRAVDKAVKQKLSRRQLSQAPLEVQNRVNELNRSKKIRRSAAKPNVENVRKAEQSVRLIFLVERVKKASSDKKKPKPPATDPPKSDV